MNREKLIALLDSIAVSHEMTGSRVICNPPPMDTDEDHIVLMVEGADLALLDHGFTRTQSPAEYEGLEDFHAYRNGVYNVIVTYEPEFFKRFCTATQKAKALNLMDKGDRINLFQRELYGNLGWVAQ